MRRSLFSLFFVAAVATLFATGCDDMDTSSPAPVPTTPTYGVYLEVNNVQYPVVDNDTLYVPTGGLQVLIPALNAVFTVNPDGTRTPADSGTIVTVTVMGFAYTNGMAMMVMPGDSLAVVIGETSFTVTAVAILDGRFLGEVAIQNRTWGDTYFHLSLHYVNSSAILDILNWGLTGWMSGTGTVSGANITAYNAAGQPTTGNDAAYFTINNGVIGFVYPNVLGASQNAQFTLWVSSTFPARSTGNDLRVNATFDGAGSVILGFAAPQSYTGTSVVVTIDGTVFGQITLLPIALDSQGYGVEYLGEPRGAGQSYTITPAAGQGVDTTPIVVTGQ